MLNFRLRKIKILFLSVVGLVVFLMVIGIFVLKNNYYFRQNYLLMQIYNLQGNLALSSEKISNEGQTMTRISRESAVSVPILLYHGVIDDSEWKPDEVNVKMTDFRDQMFAVKKAGFQTVTLDDLSAFMRGEKKLPKKSFLLTFDDARKDSYYPVDPILNVLDYNAVMFVIAGRSLHLTKKELEKMMATGRWEIGSHTKYGHDLQKISAEGAKGHFLSDRIWLDSENRLENAEEYKARVSKDLEESRNDLEKELDIEVSGFAYPFGDYGHNSKNFPESRKILADIARKNFAFSFRQAGESEFIGNFPGRDFTLLKRADINSAVSPSQLVSLLSGTMGKSIPYYDNFFKNQGWKKAWGDLLLKDGRLVTLSSPSENGSLVFLDGTFQWQDYEFKAKVSVLRGRHFAIVARYQDGNKYVSCDFLEDEAILVQKLNGQESEIRKSDTNESLANGREVDIGISVSGDEAACLIEGKAVLTGKIDQELNHGGIGFKTWDEKENNSYLAVKDVRVENIEK